MREAEAGGEGRRRRYAGVDHNCDTGRRLQATERWENHPLTLPRVRGVGSQHETHRSTGPRTPLNPAGHKKHFLCL